MSKIKYLIILPLIVGALTYLVTRKLPAQYEVETSIYTGITSNTGLDVSASRVDRIVTQNEYNNVLTILKSQSLHEEVSLRLLSEHLMLSKPQKEIISEEAFTDLQESIPPDVKKLAVKGNPEKTYQNLKKIIKPNRENYLYSILNYNHPYYSYKALSNIKVEQINSSDIIQLTYNIDDPGICYNTLKITARVFIDNYGELKKNQRNSAVKYFQNKLDEVSKKLNDSEDELLKFNISNNIINYYEQTKQVTTQHEEIELRLQDVKMKNEGSIAVLKKLEDQISKRFTINLRNVEILNIRKLLVECNNEIAQTEVRRTDNSADVTINSLYKMRNGLEKRLENSIDSIYKLNNNSEGIESRNLLGSWLDAVKEFEASTAMLKSMKIRLDLFVSQFKLYAPLGSTTKRIERQINVFESEYLEILNNLNGALQNEQNTDMISNMRIIDEAKYPINAVPSKKKIYVLISMIFTFIFYVFGLFSIKLMDHRIKTPAMIESLTGIPFLCAFCLTNNKKFPNTELIIKKAILYVTEKIRLFSANTKKPYIIQIISIWNNSGKSLVANHIHDELEKKGFQVKTFKFMSAFSDIIAEENMQLLQDKFYTTKNYSDLLGSEEEKLDYIISIIPPIGEGIENPLLLQDADINFVVYDANLTWSKADSFQTEKLKKLVNQNIYSILTNAYPEDLEEVYGEIQKNRSKLRVKIKKTLKRITN